MKHYIFWAAAIGCLRTSSCRPSLSPSPSSSSPSSDPPALALALVFTLALSVFSLLSPRVVCVPLPSLSCPKPFQGPLSSSRPCPSSSSANDPSDPAQPATHLYLSFPLSLPCRPCQLRSSSPVSLSLCTASPYVPLYAPLICPLP
jgi:hypothetical protein